MSRTLLTREEFKKQVFAKTSGKCCVPGCGLPAVDAHHIMDRKLWTDGGYYLDNGASLCEIHHLQAEKGIITPKRCYELMGVTEYPRPDKVDWLTDDEFKICVDSEIINKWGK